MAEEQYSYIGDQGMQLPAQGTVLDACYTLTGDVMTTASVELVQNQEVGCVQVCLGSCAAFCLETSQDSWQLPWPGFSHCLYTCVKSQVWGAEQNGWRLLHTTKVRLIRTAVRTTSCMTVTRHYPNQEHLVRSCVAVPGRPARGHHTC
jgi:hypothetical protein